MSERRSERLSAEDWIREGLRALTSEGAAGLKAERLAPRLGVSRGSFYWHFKNVAAFHQALLDHWRSSATEAIIEELERQEDPVERLISLMRQAYASEMTHEKALRAWATENRAAAAAVAAVDQRRVAYLQSQFSAAGCSQTIASANARFVYWAYLGRAGAAGDGLEEIDERQIRAITLGLVERSL